ncbi:MAG: oligosaccharide flippase family protein [Endomicrobiales bacterium]|nr:oligosaccharide flippase family protein [Endomicrobiales bacterium]
MSTALKSIVKNTVYLNISTVISRLLAIITSAIIARHIGQTQFGQFTVFISLSNILVILSDFGMSPYVIGEVARKKDDSSNWLKQILTLKTIIYAFIVISIVILILTLHIAIYNKLIIIASAIYASGRSYFMVFDSFFNAHGYFFFSALWEFFFAFFVLILITTLYFIGLLNIQSTNAVYCISIYLLFLISFLKLTKSIVPLKWPLPSPNYSIIHESHHYMLAALAGVIFANTDILFLRWLKGPAETGYYGVVLTIFTGMLFIISNINKVLYPFFSMLNEKPVETFRHYVNKIFWFSIVFLLPFTAGGIILSQQIVTFIYGNQYLPASKTMAFIFVAFAFQFLGSFFVTVMQSARSQRFIARINWAAVLITFLAAVPLIVYFGHTGAAVGRSVTNFFILTCCCLVVHMKITPLKLNLSLFKPIAATVLMVVVLKLLTGHNLFLRFFAGFIVYCASLVALKTFTIYEYKTFINIFFKRRAI